MKQLSQWKGRPIAALTREDLIKALTEASAPRGVELPPMVRGTVFAPAAAPVQAVHPGRAIGRKGGMP